MVSAKDRVVIKFGGADLSTGEKVEKAAEMVIESGHKESVVVVSAMGNTTSELLDIVSKIGITDDREYASIVSMGEMISVRLFCSALRAKGASAIYLEPSMEEWPIITDSNFRDAKPNMEETRIRVKKFLEPKLKENYIVICGFLGRDRSGNLTTLGRGGSDTTALVIGNCLLADEVVLVKDTEGVMSADPKIVEDAKPLERLGIYEMFVLARGGAKIVKAEALRYKLPEQKLRIVNFSNGLNSNGTEIFGNFNFDSFEINEKNNIVAISLVGEIESESMSALFSKFAERPLYGISTGKSSITVFTSIQNTYELLNELHSLDAFKAVSSRDKVGMIEVTHPLFIDSPGWIAKISVALASRRINIIEITTSKASIRIFVDEEDTENSIQAVKEVLTDKISTEGFTDF